MTESTPPEPTPAGPALRHRRESVGNLRLHWVEEGEGPPVILLHGFPEFWYAWRYQLPALAAAGYRAVAPDLPGYNASDRPEGVDPYRLDTVVDDIVGLIRELGAPVHLVGHDWGGVVAWRLAERHPELLRRLVVMNAPHPDAYRRTLRRPRQLLRSWYVFFFQLPWLPERVLQAFDFEVVERIMRRDIRRQDVLRETDFRRYVEAIARPGALTAALNYYRAAGRDAMPRWLSGRSAADRAAPRRGAPRGRVDVPTLLVWGERDRYLTPGLTEGLERWVPDLQVERIADASHWVQVEAHEHVNQVLTWFLGETEERPAPPGRADPGRSGAAPGG